MKRIKKTITLPEDVIKWAENCIKEAKYPGVRTLSGFLEYLIRNEMKSKRG